MAGNANNLVWLDMEMTGLNPEGDRIIELAMVVTDSELRMVAESPSWVVHQSDATLAAMDDWNQKQHGASGLIARVRASTVTEREAEARTLVVNGFANPVSKELPMEYAVEMNNLIKLEMEGAIG